MAVYQKPQSSAEPFGDVRAVDLLGLVVADLGHGKQELQVLEVLVVDLPDLQLLQGDVGERDAVVVELQAVLEVDLVAVVELVEEHVDHGDGAAVVDLAGLAGHHQGVDVALVAELLQEALDLAAALAVGDEVDVGEVALAQPLQPRVEVHLLREVVVERQRAHDPHGEPGLPGGVDDALAFGQEDLRLGIPVQRDVFGQDELLGHCAAPFRTVI